MYMEYILKTQALVYLNSWVFAKGSDFLVAEGVGYSQGSSPTHPHLLFSLLFHSPSLFSLPFTSIN